MRNLPNELPDMSSPVPKRWIPVPSDEALWLKDCLAQIGWEVMLETFIAPVAIGKWPVDLYLPIFDQFHVRVPGRPKLHWGVAIEVDGFQHDFGVQLARDLRRDPYIRATGVHLWRFKNWQLHTNADAWSAAQWVTEYCNWRLENPTAPQPTVF